MPDAIGGVRLTHWLAIAPDQRQPAKPVVVVADQKVIGTVRLVFGEKPEQFDPGNQAGVQADTPDDIAGPDPYKRQQQSEHKQAKKSVDGVRADQTGVCRQE